jgi:hypothetical protein
MPALSSQLKAQIKQKGEGQENLLSLLEWGHLLLLNQAIGDFGSPDFRTSPEATLVLRSSDSRRVAGSSACRQQIMELFIFHNHMSKFPQKIPSYISILLVLFL